VAAIAGFLKLDRSSVSGLIDRAERRELVARRTSTEDARVTIVDVTPAGVELSQKLADTVNARLEQLLEGATEDERSGLLRLALSISQRTPTD
jgi:DNA-binding MarR family transcriptional regulator